MGPSVFPDSWKGASAGLDGFTQQAMNLGWIIVLLPLRLSQSSRGFRGLCCKISLTMRKGSHKEVQR